MSRFYHYFTVGYLGTDGRTFEVGAADWAQVESQLRYWSYPRHQAVPTDWFRHWGDEPPPERLGSIVKVYVRATVQILDGPKYRFEEPDQVLAVRHLAGDKDLAPRVFAYLGIEWDAAFDCPACGNTGKICDYDGGDYSCPFGCGDGEGVPC